MFRQSATLTEYEPKIVWHTLKPENLKNFRQLLEAYMAAPKHRKEGRVAPCSKLGASCQNMRTQPSIRDDKEAIMKVHGKRMIRLVCTPSFSKFLKALRPELLHTMLWRLRIFHLAFECSGSHL